jgi:broad specificity phosphatase PhoE
VFDAPLTARGRAQARGVRPRLQGLLARRERELGAALWITSPLSRAIETMLLACPHQDRLEALAGGRAPLAAAATTDHGNINAAADAAAAAAGDDAKPASSSAAAAPAGPSSSTATATTTAPLRVEVLPLIAEHCATTGDVGRPAPVLASSFPQLAPHLALLPSPTWWYDPEGPEGPRANVGHGPNPRLGSPEPAAHMRGRVAEFGRWLSSRPERLVVAVGHSTFFRNFTRARARMRNCEVQVMWW